MSPLLVKISKDLKLVCCPRSLAPTLVTLPSMSLNSSAPVETHSLPPLARRYPRDFTFYVADPTAPFVPLLQFDLVNR